ncbi:uncharacterized protein [Montipora capricornis]|uniref:uncharacterized protein n=1 Tax=Montipora capricornis TaxID=246305 RepID=UPI0035F142DA
MAAKRFQTRTEEEIEQLLQDKSSKSTNKATLNAVRTLRDFCKEQNLDESFQELSKTDLNSLLRKFYTSARKCDGSLYSKNSLVGIRYGIARYLQQEKGLKITDDEAFSTDNEAFSAVTTELKKLGKAKPIDVLYKCLFDIVFFLVRRGRENLREHTKSTFAVAVDSQSRKYVYQKEDELDKNHRADDSPYDTSCDGCMYEKPESALCPMECFELYLSKLNPDIECLWQRRKETISNDNPVWYCMAPLGKNTLGTFMKTLSKNANLSQEYTNHSIRATAVTLLDHSNFEARHIMRVSGYKSESSIRSYSRRLPENKQSEISDALSAACTADRAVLPVMNLPTNNEDLELTSSQFQHAVDSLTNSPLPNINSLPGSPSLEQNAFAQQTTLRNDGVSFASGAFYNCQVTMNFNYK